MTISSTELQKLYIAYFGRPMDPNALTYYAGLDRSSGEIAEMFSSSAESQALYGGMSASAKVTAIYQSIFGRAPEPAGLVYWTNLLEGGRVSPASAAFTILQSAQGIDLAVVDNKVKAAIAFTAALDTTAEITAYSGSSAIAVVRSFLNKVNADPASIVNLTGNVTETVAKLFPTTETTTSTGGGAAAPPFTATLASGAVTFANAGSTISMTESSNLFTFTTNGASAGTATLTISTPTDFVVPAGTVLSIDYSLAQYHTYTGPGTVELNDTGALLATRLNSLNSATTGLLDATKVTSITAASIAHATQILVTDQGTSGNKIKTAADVAVTLSGSTATAAALKAIEAATTGLVDASSVTSIIGDAADATLLLVTNQGTSGNKIKMAANATVTLGDTGAATGAALKAIADATTGIVTATSISSISDSSVATALQLLVTDNSTFVHSASVAVSLVGTTASAADLKAIDAQTTGLVTAENLTGISGTSTDIKSVLDALTVGTALSAASLNSVTMIGTVGGGSTWVNVVFANNTTLVLADVSGNFLTLADGNVRAGKSLTVDGSGLAAGNGIDFNGYAESNGTLHLIGGAGNDSFYGGQGSDMFSGGAGTETYRYVAGSTLSTLAALDTITDYRTSGADVIMNSSVTTVASNINTVQNLGGQGSLAAAVDVMANAMTTNNGVGIFLWDNDTYAYVETTGSGTSYVATDFLVKLTGTPWAAGASIVGLGIDGV